MRRLLGEGASLGLLLLTVLALAPPGALALDMEPVPCDPGNRDVRVGEDGVFLPYEVCRDLHVILQAPTCIAIDVASPAGTFHQPPLSKACFHVSELGVAVDGERAQGRIAYGTDVPATPVPAGAAPSTRSATTVPLHGLPESSAGFEIRFELRYHPCEDPLFWTAASYRASGPPPAPPQEDAQGAALATSPACEAAGRLAQGVPSPAPALDLLRALVDNLPSAPAPDAPTVPPTAGPASPASGPDENACGCVSSAEKGNASTGDDGATANASAAADTPAGPVSLAVDAPAAGDSAAPSPAAVVPADGSQRPTIARPAAARPPARTVLPVPGASASGAERASPPRDDPGPAASSKGASTPLRAAARPPLVHPAVVALVAGAALAQVALFLYSRIRRDRLLDHSARRQAYEAVRAKAATPLEVARNLDLGVGTVRYHLEMLHKAGLLGRADSPRGPVFHPLGARPEAAPQGLQERVLRAVAESPGIHASALARKLGASKGATQDRVLDLLASGRIVHRREGKTRRLYPTEAFMGSTGALETR